MFPSVNQLDITLILAIFSSISVSIVHSNDPSDRRHYSLDPRATKRLALAEEHLTALATSILSNLSTSIKYDSCYFYLHKYLNEFNQDTQAVNGTRGIGRATIATENPNLALRMIRRNVVILSKHAVNSCKISNPDIEATIKDIFTAVDLTLPIQQDLEDALMGILRIHYVYGFNATNETRLGIFNGVDTKAHLYFEDCLALANKAIELEAETLAYQWLISASTLFDEMPTFKKAHLLEETKSLKSAWSNLQTSVKVDNIEDLHKLLHNRTQDVFGGFDFPENYATCRGEFGKSLAYQSKLRCFYQFNWDPYFSINPVKTEVLSGHPLIYQFYDFVGDRTIDFIKKHVRNRMYISEHSTEGGSKVTIQKQMRTSVTGWIGDSDGTKLIPKMVTLTRRFEKLTGLKLLKKWASAPTQYVLYGSLGGHYEFHFDSLQNSKIDHKNEGDRLATILMFLADTKMGGYTGFPLAGVFAKPVKGSAILWYNTKLNGDMDARAKHGGCPVILGVKEVGTRMIHQYENMFREPCTLDAFE